jgi:hypothetical protein
MRENALAIMFSFPYLYLITYGKVSINSTYLACLLLNFFSGKLTYVLKEEDTKNYKGHTPDLQ